MLILEHIMVGFDEESNPFHMVLHCLNLHVKRGEFVVIIGGNGSGKSTLFNVIAGSLRPKVGKVILDDINVTKISQHGRSGDMARVEQNTFAGTMANMTVLENLAFAFMRGKNRKLLPYSYPARVEFFSQKLKSIGTGLEKRLQTPVSSLSGGQRQALSLLMAILAPSKILLLDEITAALDPATSDVIMGLADKIIRNEGRTTLMITHNMAHAIEYGDRLLLLADGAFVQEFRGKEKENLTPAALANIFDEI
jgi:putative ABC transport system ATP-binding protein